MVYKRPTRSAATEIRKLPALQLAAPKVKKRTKTTMDCKVLFSFLALCLLLLSPMVVEESQALAVDKKKIMKALFLTKLALKKKKLLVVPLPVPIMVEKKHQEHHIEHHGWDKHHGW